MEIEDLFEETVSSRAWDEIETLRKESVRVLFEFDIEPC